MQNYLDIKKIHNLRNKNRYSSKQTNINRSKNVDINTLLNRVKLNEKNKTKENLIFLAIGLASISAIGLFLLL
tara:strand:+ start:351 stop:569 length:219 start_codon:yes stop_codon:yes gene_type:complete